MERRHLAGVGGVVRRLRRLRRYGTGPIDYDYGNNIVYQNGDVYMNGQNVDTAAEYYNQVADQADGGADATANANGQWLPLGVFALDPGATSSNPTACCNWPSTRRELSAAITPTRWPTRPSPIQGSVDEKTQRVAWTVGDNQTTVLEGGLYNLTQPEAPVLIHFGADKTEQWLLVRLDKNQAVRFGVAARRVELTSRHTGRVGRSIGRHRVDVLGLFLPQCRVEGVAGLRRQFEPRLPGRSRVWLEKFALDRQWIRSPVVQTDQIARLAAT